MPAIRNLGPVPSDREVRGSPRSPLNSSGGSTAFHLLCSTQGCWEHLLVVNWLEETKKCLRTGLGLASVLLLGKETKNMKKWGKQILPEGAAFWGSRSLLTCSNSQLDRLTA